MKCKYKHGRSVSVEAWKLSFSMFFSPLQNCIGLLKLRVLLFFYQIDCYIFCFVFIIRYFVSFYFYVRFDSYSFYCYFVFIFFNFIPKHFVSFYFYIKLSLYSFKCYLFCFLFCFLLNLFLISPLGFFID